MQNENGPCPLLALSNVLILRGSSDRFLSASATADLAAVCSRGRLAEVAGAGHHIALEAPQLVAEEIGAVVAGVVKEQSRLGLYGKFTGRRPVTEMEHYGLRDGKDEHRDIYGAILDEAPGGF